MDTNPFESPKVDAASSELVSERIIEVLLQTKPWVRLFSVLGFIGTGLMALVCVLGLIGILATGASNVAALGLLIYVPIAVICFFCSLHLARYASRIQEFSITPRAEALEEALAAQRSYWRLLGIIALAFIGIYLLVLVGAVFWGGMSAMP